MFDNLINYLLPAETWQWNVLGQQTYQVQGTPFLSSIGVYLDIGDHVCFKQTIRIIQPEQTNLSCRIGKVISVKKQEDLVRQNIPIATEQRHFTNNQCYWVLINWWIEGSSSVQPASPQSYVGLPREMIQSNLVQWIPAYLISDVAFVFHASDIVRGKYPHTEGVRNAFYCRAMWDSSTPFIPNNFLTMPYYSIFNSNQVEKYAERVWSVIELVQNLILKLMGKRGKSQKLNQSEKVSLSPREWEIIKLRFDKSSYCFFERPGVSTVHRYGTGLTQVTIWKKSKKEIITVENRFMLAQLMDAFGVCVVSTVRERFPSGARLRLTDGFGEITRRLTSVDLLNSIMELHDHTVPNCDVQYAYRKRTRGIDFWYDPAARKLQLCIRYARVEADDGKVFDFYNGINLVEGIRLPEAENNAAPQQRDDQNQVPRIREGECFEAYNCFFQVRAIVGSDSVDCIVLERDNEADEQYELGSSFTFDNAFVSNKINDYLLVA